MISAKVSRHVPLISRFKGCLIGGAIGDAMGMPVEAFSRHTIQRNFGYIDNFISRNAKNRIKPAGSITDDTYLCMLTAKSILDSEGLDIDHLTKTYIEALPFPFGITGTTRMALEIRSRGIDPAVEIQGNRHSGSGAAVRMPPLALWGINKMDTLLDHAVTVSKITHQDNDAVAGAVALAFAIAWALRDELHPSILLKAMNNMMIDLKSNLQFNFDLALKILASNTDTIDGINEIGTDGASVRLIPSAFYAFLRNPNDFESTILACVNAGGDTDSRAAIAGFISGAYNGIEAIPAKWANKITSISGMNANVINDYAERLYSLSSSD